MASAGEVSGSERLAVVGLWSVPGIGPVTMRRLRKKLGALAEVLDVPAREWLGSVRLSAPAAEFLRAEGTVRAIATRVLERAQAGKMQVALRGDEGAYPPGLDSIAGAPEVLFYRGEVGPPQRRLAMVGARRVDSHFVKRAQELAKDVAKAGVCVVSGAAEGVDRACHRGAIAAGGVTWAFVASALDELDPPHEQVLRVFLARRGVMYTEVPPGIRAERGKFPRRNRLISGAADAVLVLRAGEQSGSIYTARYGHQQGRPVLALPGDVEDELARGCNALIRSGTASICLGLEDLLAAVGLGAGARVTAAPPGPVASIDPSSLSTAGQAAYRVLDRCPREFEELLAKTALSSGTLTGALVELELKGLVIQRPGKRYERV